MVLLKPSRLLESPFPQLSVLRPLRSYRSRTLPGLGARKGAIIPRAELASFDLLKTEAEQAYERARELLPALEEAQRVAHDAKEPAQEAEDKWVQAHNRLSDVVNEAHATINELRDGAETALGGGVTVTADMLRHHANYRLESFKDSLTDVALYKSFKPDLQQLHWLPGATLITQTAACISEDDSPYLVACIAVAMPPLHDNLRSMLLHWSLSDSPAAPWANSIPQGWHTSPGVSQPCGLTAWQTSFGPYAPVLENEGQAASSATVFSVVVQIPLEKGSYLEERGGVKFVLKRSDGGQPEWIKPGNNSDFWVDFCEPIALYKKMRLASEKSEKASAASALAAASAEAVASTSTTTTTADESVTKSATLSEEDLSTIAVDSLDAWGWARAMALSSRDVSSSGSEGEDQGATDAADDGVNILNKSENSGEEEQQVAMNTEHEEEKVVYEPSGWLAAVGSWEAIGDYAAQSTPSLSKQVQQLRLILSAAQHHLNENSNLPVEVAGDAVEIENQAAAAQRAQQVAALLSRCHEVDETLQIYDAASFEARRAQQEKERLWELHKTASDEASRLAIEVSAAVDTARRHAAALRGRSAEVTQRDLESVASQMAESSGNGDTSSGSFWPFSAFGSGYSVRRQVAFVSQSVAHIAGLDATMLMQVYLEGDARAVQAALSGKTYSSATGLMTDSNSASTSSDEEAPAATDGTTGSGEETNTAASAPKKTPPSFDTIVISVCVAEAFPTSSNPAGLRAPVLLHFGAVPHQHGKWRAPPVGWKSQPSEGSIEGSPAPAAPGSLPWVPLQQFTITRKDGSPAFVDPIMHGACLRLPLAEVAMSGIRGVEFVLKTTEDGSWLMPASGHGGNFFIEIPLVSGN